MSTVNYNKAHPFLSTITERHILNKNGSSKETWHISLDLKGSGIHYEPGSSIAVQPRNHPAMVNEYLTVLRATGDEEIRDLRSGQLLSLKEFLTCKANLSRLTTGFLKGIEELSPLLKEENRHLLLEFIQNHEPLDFFRTYPPGELPFQEICSQFSPLLPRFYSVASSCHDSPDKVDLLVAHFTYMHGSEKRYGVGSHFLCQVASPLETPVPIYVQPTLHFRLPSDPHTAIIMVGPGTGVAPYRAFLQERLHFNAPGKNWLFFGERNRQYDFFYQEFWLSLVSQGKLRLDLAFSRDQEEKCYVQHKLMAQKKELWNWLQKGAWFYVCGDAQRMAKDVAHTLEQIIREEGSMSEEEARSYMKTMRSEKRYLIDVY